jgi:prolyl oligopeptidase
MLKIYEKDGTFVREVPLPTKGTVAGISGRLRDKEMYFLFMSYTYPGVIYRYEMASGRMAEYYRSEVGFDPDRYETEQLFVTSKDGTRVPVFVTSRKGLPRDGGNPTILYGYGGFSISLAPFFSPALIPWLESGGVYAVANLRGGGEYGTAWHDEGMLERKQNVFDDFAAAAERLIAEGITSAPKLAIEGGSNGGLLVAASLLQRPELFGAAVSQVPVTDMLRYQKIGTGRFWMTEYGDATASREAFDWLRAYSPLHNVAAGRSYPPLLVTTADGDDRVAPLHAFKFVATMQATAGSGVYLLRHDMGAGHGAGKPLEMILAEVADTYAFLARALGVSSVESES